MGESWSVFAVGEGEAARVWGSLRDHFRKARADLSELSLVRGPPIRGGIPFAILHTRRNRQTTLDDHQDGFVGPLSAALRAQVCALTGSSNTDSVLFEVWKEGRRSSSRGAEFDSVSRFSSRAGVDLSALCAWGHFGISGADPLGVTSPFDGDGGPSERDRAAQAAADALREPGRADEAAREIGDIAASGRLASGEAAGLLLEIGRPREALAFALREPSGWHERATLAEAALAAGDPGAAASLADDPDLRFDLRCRLLTALGRAEDVRALRFDDDLANVVEYASAADGALDRPDPDERICRLTALPFDDQDHPGWDLLRRCDVALARLQLGHPASPELSEEIGRCPHPAFDGHRRVLQPGLSPFDALREAVAVASRDEDRPAYARARGNLALFLDAAGDPDAADHLGEAYIRFGISSPYTKVLEAALVRLGQL